MDFVILVCAEKSFFQGVLFQQVRTVGIWNDLPSFLYADVFP